MRDQVAAGDGDARRVDSGDEFPGIADLLCEPLRVDRAASDIPKRDPAPRQEPTELVARVQAALRARPRRMTVMHGDLAVDHALRRVSVAGEDVRLTTTEFELLRVMSVAAGEIVTTEDLLRKVWGAGELATPTACAPPSRSSAPSSATARPTRPTSSTSTASATASRFRDRWCPAGVSPPAPGVRRGSGSTGATPGPVVLADVPCRFGDSRSVRSLPRG